MLFTGSGVALITPFTKNDEIDFASIDQLVDFHLEKKTS